VTTNAFYDNTHNTSDSLPSTQRQGWIKSHKYILLRPYLVFFLPTLLLSNPLWANSPPNLNTDIPWDEDSLTAGNQQSYAGVSAITTAFNNARRQEESQLGIAVNTLGNLSLPSQSIWDAMGDDGRALYLLNAERTSRTGMQAGVIGLPFAGIETHMDNIAKNYGDILHNNDATGHNADGKGPFQRIADDANIGTQPAGGSFGSTPACHEFINRAENLAAFWSSGTSIPLPVERAIYNWLYADANSTWGHREAALLQDKDIANQSTANGYKNNNGSASHAGFLGIYRRGSTDYDPFNQNSGFGSLVVMNIFDPVSEASAASNNPQCSYTVAYRTEDNSDTWACNTSYNLANNQWNQISLPCNPGSNNTVAAVFADDIPGTLGTDWALYAYDSASNQYITKTTSDTVSEGIGYWIIQKSGNAVTLDMPSGSTPALSKTSTQCPSSQGCFEISLASATNAVQWQMPGYPFIPSRAWNTLRVVTDSGACADTDGCSLDEATNLKIFNNQAWRYDANARAYVTVGSATLLPAWFGGWGAALESASSLNPRLLIPAT